MLWDLKLDLQYIYEVIRFYGKWECTYGNECKRDSLTVDKVGV